MESGSTITGMAIFGLGGLPWEIAAKYREASPVYAIERVETPLLLTQGEQDPKVPFSQGEQFYRAMKIRGKEVEFIRFPREGHGLTEPNHLLDAAARQVAWLKRYLN